MRTLLVVIACTFTSTLHAADWSQFRGPQQNGHTDAKLPTEWNANKNVAWRTEIPGKGWSSPVVAGDTIYLTTAVPANGGHSLRALSLDAKSGKIGWNIEVFQQGAGSPRIHTKNSHASATPVIEGEHLFVHFGHMGTACLNAKDGSVVWRQETLSYRPVHGNGGSPMLVGDNLVFCIDGTDQQMVVALNRKTGKVAWQTPRNANPQKAFSFSTPLLITVDGKEQLIAAGSDVVMSLDPTTGKEIWRVRYSGYSVVPRPVFGNGLVYLSTGYDSPKLLAIKPTGTGDVTDTHIAWTARRNAPHNPSPLVVGDAVYTVSDSGVLSRFDAKSGEVRWTERVGGRFSASPLYAGGLVYLLDENGTATVFKPGAEYDPVAVNKLGERSLASFGVVDDALLLRTEKALYRIEKP